MQIVQQTGSVALQLEIMPLYLKLKWEVAWLNAKLCERIFYFIDGVICTEVLHGLPDAIVDEYLLQVRSVATD